MVNFWQFFARVILQLNKLYKIFSGPIFAIFNVGISHLMAEFWFKMAKSVLMKIVNS